MKLKEHLYGKSQVRVTRLDRTKTPHRVLVASVDIALEGAFEPSYTDGDNRSVVATDTMKNTVYVLARRYGDRTAEQLAMRLAEHFIDEYEHVEAATVDVEEELWTPVRVGDRRYDDAFSRRGPENAVATASASPEGTLVTGGLVGIQVMKTSKSGFSNFHEDEYRTLADTDDRLFATTVDAQWRYHDDAAEFDADDFYRTRSKVRGALLETFAEHESLSVQQTLFEMGTAALERCGVISEISLVMPNQHHLLVDLAVFGLDNDNEVFVGTNEPFGHIEATVSR
ncbi:MAG: factor-independent urate hydroxylase [Acidobacteriota bacterium]